MNKLRRLLLASASFCCIVALGQNSIVERECWFDGKINARQTLTATIDVSDLTTGLHSVTARVKDAEGLWSSTVTRFFVIAPNAATPTAVTAREYWLDGKIAERKPLDEAVAEIDLSALTTGLHNITLRAKDDRGVWSSTVTKYFVVAPNSAAPVAITVREYWFDGKVAERKPLAEAVAEIDLSALTTGLHNITVRAQDDRGVWSSTVTKYFVVAADEAGATGISAREYWLDGDIANRQTLGESVATIDLSALSSGLHRITIRTQEDNGKWSVPVTQYFAVASDYDAEEPTLTHYIYWFDEDNAGAKSGALEDDSGIIAVSVKSLDEGEHTFNWAVGNSRGHWSAVRTEPFQVTHIALTEAMVNLAENTFEYAAEDIEPEVTVTDGEETLVRDEDFDVAYADNYNAGEATVTVTGKGFYKESIERNFTITRAVLNVTADDVEREQGQDNPELTLSYDGWKGSDDESVLTALPTATTEANPDSPVGEYEITVDGGEAQNYVFNYICGTLTVKVPVGIREVRAGDDTDGTWYDTSGLRLGAKPTKPGVYVRDGRKVLVR